MIPLNAREQELLIQQIRSIENDKQCWVRDPDMHVIDKMGELHPAKQLAGWIEVGDWDAEVVQTCETKYCLNPAHWTAVEDEEDPEPYDPDPRIFESRKIEEDLRLVQVSTFSLAELYRKGRKAGLLTATTAYK